jgi:hypothetical protein
LYSGESQDLPNFTAGKHRQKRMLFRGSRLGGKPGSKASLYKEEVHWESKLL